MTERKICTIVGSDKGGVGKSMMSQILVAAYDQAHKPLKVIEIDNQHTLSTIFGDRVDLSLDATPSNVDPRTLHTHFTQPYELWAKSDSVTDLGANVTSPLMTWMQENDIPSIAHEDNIVFRFLAVAIPDEQSLRSAVSALETARRGLGPDARLHLILNDTVGLSGFTPYENSASWTRLMTMEKSHGVNLIRIPHCASRIMDWGRARGLTVLQILEDGVHVDDICQEAGFSRIQRHQEIKLFIIWVSQVQDALSVLFRNADPVYSSPIAAQ